MRNRMTIHANPNKMYKLYVHLFGRMHVNNTYNDLQDSSQNILRTLSAVSIML